MSTLFVTMSLEEFTKHIHEAVRCAITENQIPIQTNDKEELITIGEASEFLKVSQVTIHKWKKKKLIPFYRIGRIIYFKKHELLDSLKSITIKKKIL